jgi:phosphoribosylformylglycinamidine synthase
MWQLSESIDGMAAACRALALPVIGGNVSFYNESGGADIAPTPVLGVLGLVDAVQAPPPGLRWAEGDAVVLLGARTGADGALPLAGTQWAAERRSRHGGAAGGAVPAVDFAAHGRVCALVAGLVARQVAGDADAHALVHGVHDVSSGGLAVALAELAAASGLGCAVEVDDPAELFTELPSRFVVATGDADALCAAASAEGVPAVVLGRAGGDRLALGALAEVAVSALREAYDGGLARELGDT